MLKINTNIQFKYKKNILIKGLLINISEKQITIILKTDYYGKNEEWYTGEEKTFNIKECKNIKNL